VAGDFITKHAKRKNTIINATSLLLVVVLLLVVIIILLVLNVSGFNMMNGIAGMMGAGMFSSMMNGGSGGYAGMMGGTGGSVLNTRINISTAEADTNKLPSYAHAYPDNNTVLFTSSNITLVILAMGAQRAINLTRAQPPLYDSNSSGNAFVIYGLIDPTLIIPRDAIVHVEFINLDSSEYHNVIMTATGPPYQYMPMSAMNGIVSMMPIIPHANYSGGSASEYNYTTAFANTGTYWYICMYPGHAQMGMYGKIIVE
jgi:rusticyanin